MNSDITRRTFLKVGAAAALSAGATSVMADETRDYKQDGASDEMAVAVVQFRSSHNVRDNVKRHCDYIAKCALQGARVVVFPECSVTGFSNESVSTTDPARLAEAEAAIASAAKDSRVCVIFGIPTKAPGGLYNSAVVASSQGSIIERYHKVHLAGEQWAVPGDHISVFPVDRALASIIICHDERYPELVRLPVMAGASVVFYISSESGIEEEHKIAPYRAQVMARAAENRVYIVQANTPANQADNSGSHGQSRIVKPDGNIVVEASIFDEEIITATLDLSKADRAYAQQSAKCEFLGEWWKSGVAKVRRISGT